MSTTDDDDSNWESVIEDEGLEPVENQSFERLLQRINRLENTNKRRDQKIKDLENDIKTVKTTAEKRISSLTNTVNKLLDQVKVLQSSPTPLVQPLGAPALDINNCWLSSAERLGLKKTATTVPKPTQLEIKITNSILSEQADRERRKNKLVIFGIPVHSSSATEESAKKKEEADEDKKNTDLVFQAMGVDLTKVKTVHRFRVRQESNRPPPVLVELTDETARTNFLQSAKKLRKIAMFKDVFVNADLTEKERIQQRELREQRRAIGATARMEADE